MTKNTKLTLEELMRRKVQMLESKKKKRTAELYIESLDAVITIEEPSRELVIDAQAMDDDADRYVVYESVKEPDLHDETLLKEFGVAEPMEITDIVFLPGEVTRIAMECMALAGFSDGSVKKIGDIKN